MSNLSKGIATEMDVKQLIDDGFLTPNFTPTEYTLRCVSKNRLIGLAYVDEGLLSGIADNQLVRYDAIMPKFNVSIIDDIVYPKNGGTYNHTVSAGYTWTVDDDSTWFYVTPAGGLRGTTDIELVIVSRTTTSYEERSGTLTFTENTTGSTIVYTIRQKGEDVPEYEPITLYGGPGQGEVCEATFNSTYYIEFGESFFSATELFTNQNGTTLAPAGRYRQEIGGWREWSGTEFIGNGTC